MYHINYYHHHKCITIRIVAPSRLQNATEYWKRFAKRVSLDVYQLAPVLVEESSYVGLQASLVSDHRLRRYHRKTNANVQARLSKLWDDYDNHYMMASKLLRCVVAPESMDRSSSD